MAIKIQVAPREIRRLVGAGVGKSFLKTLSEPLTNADSILKKQAEVSHASGLLDELFKLKIGDRVNTAEARKQLTDGQPRTIKIRIVTTGHQKSLCRVTDAGIGMSHVEIEEKFGVYASAKAKGEKTRSLFGRGALDVLLYHRDSTIYSVKNGVLTRCHIYREESGDKDLMCDAKELGAATKQLLQSHKIPLDILDHGTVVQFKLRDGTHIPNEDQIIAKISGFYMLRLIASDPNTRVIVERSRFDGEHVDALSYDFPLGTVVGRVDDNLSLKGFPTLPVNILVARSDVPLEADPVNIERRENGLLFVDDNDAVLDLTLLPEYERNPYLKNIYGFVRIAGLRDVLEAKLEADEAEAVLSETRDGFNRRNEIARELFRYVEQHVKAIYEAEEKAQKQGNTKRSETLDQRINDALKAINQFNAEETDEEGEGGEPKKPKTDAIYFSVDSFRLHVGVTRRVNVYINHDKINEGEIVLFESDNENIRIEPDSTVVKTSKKETHHRVPITITCDVKGTKGKVVALSLDKNGREVRAELHILGVDDAPVFEPPEDIAFTAPRYTGEPSRARNNATLLVNLKQFSGMPTIHFGLEEVEGKVTLENDAETLEVKVTQSQVIAGQNVARVVVPFSGTGWGQNAVLRARVKRSDGKMAETKCKLKFERTSGDQKFSDFLYEDLDRRVLGDVASGKLYINSGYPLHREIFGETEADFHKSLEGDARAQTRAVSVLVETAVYHTATTKYQAGGKKGLYIDRDDPIGSLRPFMDESKMKLEPKIYQALVK